MSLSSTSWPILHQISPVPYILVDHRGFHNLCQLYVTLPPKPDPPPSFVIICHHLPTPPVDWWCIMWTALKAYQLLREISISFICQLLPDLDISYLTVQQAMIVPATSGNKTLTRRKRIFFWTWMQSQQLTFPVLVIQPSSQQIVFHLNWLESEKKWIFELNCMQELL